MSIATVYRAVRLFEEAGILERHDFGDGEARYEPAPEVHHDHLIDVETGQVVEFVDPELEALQRQVAERLSYRLVDHHMELYAVKLKAEWGSLGCWLFRLVQLYVAPIVGSFQLSMIAPVPPKGA